MSNAYAIISIIPENIYHEVIDVKLFDDDGREITNPKVLRLLEAVYDILPEPEKKPEEPDYSDIEVYDDDGNRITDPDTLEAIRESDEIIAAWERIRNRYTRDDKVKAISNANIYHEVIDMKLFDDDGREITNPKVLRLLEAVYDILPETEKKPEVPDYSDIVLYDDDGNRITDPDTLEAVWEARQIAAEWRRSKGYSRDDKAKAIA